MLSLNNYSFTWVASSAVYSFCSVWFWFWFLVYCYLLIACSFIYCFVFVVYVNCKLLRTVSTVNKRIWMNEWMNTLTRRNILDWKTVLYAHRQNWEACLQIVLDCLRVSLTDVALLTTTSIRLHVTAARLLSSRRVLLVACAWPFMRCGIGVLARTWLSCY